MVCFISFIDYVLNAIFNSFFYFLFSLLSSFIFLFASLFGFISSSFLSSFNSSLLLSLSSFYYSDLPSFCYSYYSILFYSFSSSSSLYSKNAFFLSFFFYNFLVSITSAIGVSPFNDSIGTLNCL